MRTLSTYVACHRSRRDLRFLAAVIFIAVICVTEAVAQPGVTINVWCVGSPFTREVRERCLYSRIQQQAQKFDYAIATENIRAVDFAARFLQAVEEKRPPEILILLNFGVLTGSHTPAGRFEGLLERDPAIAATLIMVHESLAAQPLDGWKMLVSTAANHDAAKRMALQPLPCPVQSDSSRLPRSELENVSELATQVARAYLLGDTASLAAASDEMRLGNKSFLPGTNVTVEKLHVCGVHGNERLAFVNLASTFSTSRRPVAPVRNFDYYLWFTLTPLGQQSLLTVFRKNQGQWRLLAISDDPVNTGYSARGTATATSLERLTGLMAEDHVISSISARLVTPDGAKVKVTPPPNVTFGDFEWTPSPDATVVCEVAEFVVADNSTPRERTRLFFLFGRERRLSAGKLWGRAGRWRVWSISRSGDVAMSESHAYRTH